MYLIKLEKSEDFKGLVKFRRTGDLEKRLRQYQLQYPIKKVQLINSWKVPAGLNSAETTCLSFFQTENILYEPKEVLASSTIEWVTDKDKAIKIIDSQKNSVWIKDPPVTWICKSNKYGK